jgi:cell division protein FtsQ
MRENDHNRKNDHKKKRGAALVNRQPRVRVSPVVFFRRFGGLVMSFWRLLVSLPWLQALKVVLFGAVTSLLWVGQQTLWGYLDQPIATAEIRGSFVHLKEDDLRVEMTRALGRGFFSVDIAAVKQRVERQPWVDQASIKRIWPDRLEIVVVEEVPVASWNGLSFLNPYGKIFSPKDVGVVAQTLPVLQGPSGQEGLVLTTYVKMQAKLAAENIQMVSLNLEPRGAWIVGVAGGISVMLGRENIDARLDRFARVYNGYLHANIDRVKLIDARYTNGVSVSWRDAVTDKETGGKEKS